MSLAALPPELRLRIADFVRDSCYGDVGDLRWRGLKLALVSKDWRLPGTLLAWDTVVLSPQVERVLEHMKSYPESARLVRSLYFYQDLDTEYNPVTFKRLARTVLPKLLGLGTLELHLEDTQILQLFSKLLLKGGYPRLRQLTLTAVPDEEEEGPTRPTRPIFLEALPALKTLRNLRLNFAINFDNHSCRPSSSPVLPDLKTLHVFLSPPEYDEPAPEDYDPEPILAQLFSLIEPSSLVSLSISTPRLGPSTLSLTSPFTALTSLILHFEPSDLRTSLDLLPPLISKLARLKKLEVLATHTPAILEAVAPSIPQFKHFLHSLPLSLVFVRVHFDLSDHPATTVKRFLADRLAVALSRLSYYDRTHEADYLDRPVRSHEFVLLDWDKKKSRNDELIWQPDSTHFILHDPIRYR